MRSIKEIVREVLMEGRFDRTATPHFSHTDTFRNIGKNPLYTDNGGHSSRDVSPLVSTYDTNGANFRTDNNIVLSDNKFIIYKIKNFGNDSIESTLSLFGRGAGGEKELRRAIDTINGAALRNGRSVKYRTITSEAFKASSKRTNQMAKTFWEFSLDNGSTWNILKPEPIQNLQQSKLVYRLGESRMHRINEAQDEIFSLNELSSLSSFKHRMEYCRKHLGRPIGNGSSRVVFQLNDQHCLKLAKNRKGIAQNTEETYWDKQRQSCFPKIFDYDDEKMWIVCEYVLPAEESDFQHCLGMTWSEFNKFIRCCQREYYNPYHIHNTQTFYDQLETNSTLRDLYDYITNYQPPIGDLLYLKNYGMVRRYNEDLIVLLDHGLSEEIWKEYYQR